MKIGILALQGAFVEHEQMLKRLNIETHNIRKPADLDLPMDGLIIPGGESTAIGKLLADLGMKQTLYDKITSGLPVFGTCAGLLLLAKETTNDGVYSLKTMNITAKRNAYGRQLSSFMKTGIISSIGAFPMVFIRAPYIESIGDGVEALAELDGRIVAARSGTQLVTAFHPELTDDPRIHQLFISMCQSISKSKA